MTPRLKSETWRSQALCADDSAYPTASIFADSAADRRPARDACLACPVREACLKSGLENSQLWGVWGGLDQDEIRRALSVDVDGNYIERIRPPQCPNCHARPQALKVIPDVPVEGKRPQPGVKCGECAFLWVSATSVMAVKKHWREKTRKKKLRAKAPRGTLKKPRTVNPPRPAVQEPLTRDDVALTAAVDHDD